MQDLIIPLLISLAVIIVLFLILREVNMWYWKINERISIQNQTNTLLEKILTQLKISGSDETIVSVDKIESSNEQKGKSKFVQHQTDKGIVEIEPCIHIKGQKAFMNGQPAPDGTYRFGFLWNVHIKDGIVTKG